MAFDGRRTAALALASGATGLFGLHWHCMDGTRAPPPRLPRPALARRWRRWRSPFADSFPPRATSLDHSPRPRPRPARPRSPPLPSRAPRSWWSSSPPRVAPRVPQADAALAALSRTQEVKGAEVIPLELHVDYWNQLGWVDPFSAPEFTARQEAYARVFGGDGLYTPQLVVDGASSGVGSAGWRCAGWWSGRRPTPKAALEVKVAPANPGTRGHGAALHQALLAGSRWRSRRPSCRARSNAERTRGRTLAHAPVARLLVERGSDLHRSTQVRLGLSKGWRRETAAGGGVRAGPAGTGGGRRHRRR